MDSKTYFTKIIRVLDNECETGLSHYWMWKNIEDLKEESNKNLDKSSNLTSQAHYDSCLLHLFRLVDIHPDSRGIMKFLKFIENHLRIFKFSTPEEVKKSVEEDRDVFRNSGNVIKNIIGLRDKYYAHLDRKYFFERRKVLIDFPVSQEQLENLYININKILQRYFSYYYGNKVE